jgi:hypothetical protein
VGVFFKSGYSSALERLAAYPTAQAVNDVQVWKDVLIELIKHRGADEQTLSQQSSPRGFQFARHHVQQWLTAFGAASLSLNRLRPLVTDETGKCYPFIVVRWACSCERRGIRR